MPLGDGWRTFGDGWRPFGNGYRPFDQASCQCANSVFVRAANYAGFGLGYLPDLPDRRDRSLYQIVTKSLEKKITQLEDDRLKTAVAFSNLKVRAEAKRALKLKDEVDLGRDNFSPVEDQGSIGSCTAQAVIGLAEYLILVGTKEVTDLSRMFLYKASRNLMGVEGDTGSYVRTAIKALAAFGAPPEDYWPYAEQLLDVEPQAYQYSYASNFRAVRYARLDDYKNTPDETLIQIKSVLSAGLPVAFGFPVYDSIDRVGKGERAVIPYPKQQDRLLGGHAVLATGYKMIGNTEVLIIRNSWSREWGDEGYGYLPISYVTDGMAVDFWTIFSSAWLNEGRFNEP